METDNIHETIKDLRLKCDITQEQLATLSGIPYSTISKIESGHIKSPSYKKIVKLLETLNSFKPTQSTSFEDSNVWITELEDQFNVIYPTSNFATYKSLVNYSNDLKKPIQRWYRYKEGYSVDLMKNIFNNENLHKGDLIVDPFAGSGTTLLAAKDSFFNSIGYEVNPFVYDLAKIKVADYSTKDLQDFNEFINTWEDKIRRCEPSYYPALSTFPKLFNQEIGLFILKYLTLVKKIPNYNVQLLAKMAMLSISEEISNYRKAGNGLKIRNNKLYKMSQYSDVKDRLIKQLSLFQKDIELLKRSSKLRGKSNLFLKSSLDGMNEIPTESVKGVIYSPPYANCFDYTEIYKIELWLGEYVKNYNDLKILREKSVRSHLNGFTKLKQTTFETKSIYVNHLFNLLSATKLWDKRIPLMIHSYFSDMFAVISELYPRMKKGGFYKIIVSNSSYGGIIVPTDLILAHYAEQVGFSTQKIEVARYIITSSQQYKKTLKYKNYLRESIVHLRK